MATIPMTPHQKTLHNEGASPDPIFKGLDVLHQPADCVSLRSKPFVCVGREISVMSSGIQFCISGVFVSPSGDVSIILKGRPSSSVLSRIIEHIQAWDYDELDSFSSDYTYLNFGQAYRIIDIMAKHGHLKFSGAQALSAAVGRNMKNGSFYLLCTDSSI